MVNKLTITQALIPFLDKPKEKLHLARISKEINTPHPTLRIWLNLLYKENVLKKEIIGRLTMYSINTEHPNIIDFLCIAEKQKLIEFSEKNILLSEMIQFLNKNIDNSKIAIFGSATESMKKANDIDLLIVGKQDLKKINMFSERLGKKLHIVQVPSLTKITPALKSEIIKKHLLIRGSEDIIRWFIWQQ